MNEEEFKARIERELTRVQIELRLQEERLAKQEIRILQLESRTTQQLQRIEQIQAQHDQLVHKLNLVLRLIGLSEEDLTQLTRKSFRVRYLLNTIGRREN